MSQSIVFLTPRLVGDRFADHAIPLEILKDLAALEEMILEVAKWRYLQEHPGRKRSPRGFIDDVSLKLTAIESGSACVRIEAVFEMPKLFPPETLPPEHFEYFVKARDSIIDAVDAAEHGEVITHHLPDFLLGYFDRIGRGLRDAESIEFHPAHPERTRVLKRPKLPNEAIFRSCRKDHFAKQTHFSGPAKKDHFARQTHFVHPRDRGAEPLLSLEN